MTQQCDVIYGWYKYLRVILYPSDKLCLCVYAFEQVHIPLVIEFITNLSECPTYEKLCRHSEKFTQGFFCDVHLPSVQSESSFTDLKTETQLGVVRA